MIADAYLAAHLITAQACCVEFAARRRATHSRSIRRNVARRIRICSEANPCEPASPKIVKTIRWCLDNNPCPNFNEMWEQIPLDWQETSFMVPQQDALK